MGLVETLVKRPAVGGELTSLKHSGSGCLFHGADRLT